MNTQNPTVITGQEVIEATASALQFLDLVHLCYTYEHTEENPILEESTANFVKHKDIHYLDGREATDTIIKWNKHFPHIIKKNVSLDKSKCIPCWDIETFLDCTVTYMITDAIETVTYNSSAFDDEDHNKLVEIVADMICQAYRVLYLEDTGSTKKEIIFEPNHFYSRIHLVNAVCQLIELHKATKDKLECEEATLE